jgi:hypothetical protein
MLSQLRNVCIALALLFALAVPANAGPYEDGDAAYQLRDYATALKHWRPLALLGHARAQFKLGFMYQLGWGVAQNDTEAVKWYIKAAEQGDRTAQFHLGFMYANNRGVPLDNYAEAVKWFNLATEQNYPGAREWRKNIVAILHTAAQQGDAIAQVNLGIIYEKGYGVPQDRAEALNWYRKAAEQGHVDALQRLVILGEEEQKPAPQLGPLKLGPLSARAPKSDSEKEPTERTHQLSAENLILEQKGSAPLFNETRVALVIGNSIYEHTIILDNPKNDARDMTVMLKGMGFEVIEGTDLDKHALEGKVREFAQRAKTADISMFFYAGHGLQVAGENYLVPVDAQLADESALTFELLKVSAVTHFMSGEGKIAIVLLDACRDNPLAKVLARSLAVSRSGNVGHGLAPLSTSAGGMLIGFATAPGDVAADGEDLENSPFTTALLKHFPQEGLELQQVMTRVKAEVLKLTDGKQRPWHNSDLAREVYLFPSARASDFIPGPISGKGRNPAEYLRCFDPDRGVVYSHEPYGLSDCGSGSYRISEEDFQRFIKIKASR